MSSPETSPGAMGSSSTATVPGTATSIQTQQSQSQQQQQQSKKAQENVNKKEHQQQQQSNGGKHGANQDLPANVNTPAVHASLIPHVIPQPLVSKHVAFY